jgi:hypothetical protein
MITTLGATVSKTLAKALFSAWTTSLPCSAAAAGTVGVGATSGVAAKIDPPKDGFAVANIVLAAKSGLKIDNKRIRLDLDSTKLATFN